MKKVGYATPFKKAAGRVTSDDIYKASRVREALQALFDQEKLRRNGSGHKVRWADCWNCHQIFALINNLSVGDTCPYCSAKELLK